MTGKAKSDTVPSISFLGLHKCNRKINKPPTNQWLKKMASWWN